MILVKSEKNNNPHRWGLVYFEPGLQNGSKFFYYSLLDTMHKDDLNDLAVGSIYIYIYMLELCFGA